jgi:hypothetical protein
MIFINSYTSFPAVVQTSVEYPPSDAPLTGSSTLISGKSYGNGTYTVSWSSSAGSPTWDGWHLFDKLSGVSPENGAATGPLYLASGAHIGTTPSTNGVIGQWFDIVLPSSITVMSYSIGNRFVDGSLQSPNTWSVMGSNDGGSSWINVDSRNGITWASNGIVKNYTVASPGSFTKYRMVINRNNGTDFCSIGELRLFGF